VPLSKGLDRDRSTTAPVLSASADAFIQGATRRWRPLPPDQCSWRTMRIGARRCQGQPRPLIHGRLQAVQEHVPRARSTMAMRLHSSMIPAASVPVGDVTSFLRQFDARRVWPRASLLSSLHVTTADRSKNASQPRITSQNSARDRYLVSARAASAAIQAALAYARSRRHCRWQRNARTSQNGRTPARSTCWPTAGRAGGR